MSFYALYFLFFPFIVFSLFVYFSFMKRSYVKYIFEDFDEEYYKINLVKGKSYIKKLILSVILISVLGISTLYFYNNPSDFSLPNLFILRRYSASDGGMPISNKTNNILVGLLVGYGINGVLMFILFAVKLRHARLMKACAEQFSEGYVINN